MTESDLVLNEFVNEPDAVSYKSLDVYLAGVMYDDRYLVVPHLSLREQIRLCREPDNPQDSNAIIVETQSGQQIGYIRRELAALLAPQMGVDKQCLDATITELSSDACGSRFRVRIRFSVPTNWLNPPTNAAETDAQSMEFYFDDSGLNMYVLLNCSEEQFNEVREKMISEAIPFTRYGLCYRPASNGQQYQWYVRIDRTSNLNRNVIDEFFKKNFDLTADHENIRILEESKKRFEAEIVDLQAALTKHRQEAEDYENLAEEIDAESRLAKQELRQKIEQLQAEVEGRENEIRQIEDEKRRLRHENVNLRSSLMFVNPDSGTYDVPDNVADVLIDVISDNLTPSQALRVISKLFPTRVEILESAWDSADNSKSFHHRKQLFDLLWRLVTEYWYALASGRSDTEARFVFGEHYSAKESELVEKNRRAKQLRTFNYRGKEVPMMRHLKIGVKDSASETIRVHFEWLADERKIVVGYCGPHLEQK
jgi:hypothetical protein